MGELRQMKFKNLPWRVVVLSMLLNRTRGDKAEPVAVELFKRWPTEHALSNADPKELEDLLRPLGLQRQRSRHLRLLSARWSACGPPENRDALLLMPGAGEYVADAWEIICRGRTAIDPADKELLRHVEFARALAKDTA